MRERRERGKRQRVTETETLSDYAITPDIESVNDRPMTI